MGNIVFILSHISHQNATFKLAKILSKHNYNVIYAGPLVGIDNQNLKANVTKEDFEFEELIIYPSSESPLKDEEHSFSFYIDSLISGEPFFKLAKMTSPQLIVLDIHYPIFSIIFYALGIPVVFISTEILTDQDEYIPPLTSNLIPEQTIHGRVSIKRLWDAYYNDCSVNPGFIDFLEKLSKQYEFPFKKLFNSKRCVVPFGFKLPELILWPSEFDFKRSPEGHIDKFFLGALVDLDRNESRTILKTFTKTKPLIYCSFGTRSSSKEALKEQLLNNLIQLFLPITNYQFIIVTGENFKLSIDTQLPINLLVIPEAPQLQILKQCDVMINHAGGNSIKECIRLGVPMLCFPFDNDQFGNSARVVFHKVGLEANLSPFNGEEVLEKVLVLLKNRVIRTAVREFQNVFERGEDGKYVVALIHSFLKPGN